MQAWMDVPPAATSGNPALCPQSIFVFRMIPTTNDNCVHKSNVFHHDTNCGLRGVRSEFLYLFHTSVKIL